jgi:hypothetical protein
MGLYDHPKICESCSKLKYIKKNCFNELRRNYDAVVCKCSLDSSPYYSFEPDKNCKDRYYIFETTTVDLVCYVKKSFKIKIIKR